MARMIPPLVSRDSAPGERLVFQRLASDPATDGWVVLHSQDLAEHVRQVQGEADFVVIVPGRGVAVIEVKSHRQVARRPDGMWLLGGSAPTARSPFRQADEAMFSIKAYLERHNIDLRSTPMVSAAWFTHVRARRLLPASTEWHPWQVLDRDDLPGGAGHAIMRLIDNGRQHLARRIPAMATSSGPDKPAMDAIVAALRPRFELGAGSADLRRERNAQLSAFLNEQYEALDAMENNPRVLFSGPAGSGKTFLAIEAARREAATSGRTGWMLCFNRALGGYLKSRCAGAGGVEAGSLHALLLRIAGREAPSGAGAEFWQGELVDAAAERLLEGDLTRDYLIVDEVQDLSAPGYLDVLDLLVDGGLAGGRCLMFGDFDRQALFGTEDGRQYLEARVPGLPTFNLVANCRNLPRIGATVEFLSGMQPGYRKYRRTDDGIQPRYYWYSDRHDQGKLLVQAVRDLRDEGYRMDEITILSARRLGSAASECTDPWLRPHLIDSAVASSGKVRCSTVHAFKGLESPAVIVTDLDEPHQPGFEALLYVGLTRPTDRLSVLASREALADKVLRQGGRNGGT